MQKISKTDFTVKQTGHGRWAVTYESPATAKRWTFETTDARIIATLDGREDWTNAEAVPQSVLNSIKARCKAGY